MDIKRRLIVPFGVLLLVTACAGTGTAPSGSPSPGVTVTPAPSPSPSPSPSADGVDDEATAAARVLASDPRFAGIGPLSPDVIGQSAWYEVASDGDGYTVTVHIGWGDCMAGCIESREWTYAVARDGTIELEEEAGDPLPDDIVPVDVSGDATLDLMLVAGPTCPVVTDPPDPACDARPVQNATVVIRDASGTEVARTTSDAAGHARATLPAGIYIVEALPVEGLMSTPPATAVWAIGTDPLPVTLSYDTGIR
jgi:hypothetical protein